VDSKQWAEKRQNERLDAFGGVRFQALPCVV
jgi:hypothetical protein